MEFMTLKIRLNIKSLQINYVFVGLVAPCIFVERLVVVTGI